MAADDPSEEMEMCSRIALPVWSGEHVRQPGMEGVTIRGTSDFSGTPSRVQIH